MAEKERQHKLAAVIKGVHSKLRKRYKSDKESFDEAWDAHCQNDELLSEYASAMFELATDVWAVSKKETRIDWCRDICQEFFYCGGLQRAIEKDKRRQMFKDSSKENSHVTSHKADLISAINCHKVHLPMKEKIRLLDVGSCYDPFEGYPDFLPVAIDLSPAVQSVLKCDFLKLQISETVTDHIELYLQTLTQPVNSLPRCSFHVVIFSLLLEYLPSVTQRWLCCQKAHQLLLHHGLLLIITPDSNHQNKNAPMMKSWKAAIESLGFSRWRYVKQEHLHCMAFRKTRETLKDSLAGAEDMLHIPQDFSETLEETNVGLPHGRNDHAGSCGVEELGELPFCDDFDM